MNFNHLRYHESAHFIWALLFSGSLTLSFFLLQANVFIGNICFFSLFSIYLLFGGNRAIEQYKITFFLLILMGIQTLISSIYVARSFVLYLQIASSFFFFCALVDIEDYEKIQKEKIYNAINLCLVGFGLLQASALIIEFLDTRFRSTGILLDYSQASFFILVTFILSLKATYKSPLWNLYVLILFLGFFTAYSRTSNFLLVFFLIIAAYYRFFSKDSNLRISTLFVIGIAFLAVHYFPLLINEEVVSRGGLAHFKTLNSRTFYWESAIEAIKQNPIWGYGLTNYEYLGIKEKVPVQLVVFPHNDYLETWVSLGIFWVIVLMASIAFILIKYLPIRLWSLKLKTTDLETFMAWTLILCGALYMIINFIVYALTFQILIAITLSRLVKGKVIND